MKTIKTADLVGNALDWAVAKCASVPVIILDKPRCVYHAEYGAGRFKPSSKWENAGPIIESEGIDLWCNVPSSIAEKNVGWKSSWRAAYHRCGTGSDPIHGPTPLIAAMRAFVMLKLGYEVEIPDELT